LQGQESLARDRMDYVGWIGEERETRDGVGTFRESGKRSSHVEQLFFREPYKRTRNRESCEKNIPPFT
jgi:hypothetical protein